MSQLFDFATRLRTDWSSALLIAPLCALTAGCSAVGQLAYDEAARQQRTQCEQYAAMTDRQACRQRVDTAERQALEQRQKAKP